MTANTLNVGRCFSMEIMQDTSESCTTSAHTSQHSLAVQQCAVLQ